MPEIVVNGLAKPEFTLSADALQSLSGLDMGQLLTLLAPQTVSARSGLGPIVLVNGRLASQLEVNELPFESIERVDIYSEDQAIKMGFSGDQKLIVITTKKHYRGVAAKLSEQVSSEGDGQKADAALTGFKIDPDTREMLKSEWIDQRDILDSQRPLLVADGNERTLLPESKTLKVSGTLAGNLGEASSAFGASMSHVNSDSLLGPAAVSGPGSTTVLNQQSLTNTAHVDESLMGLWNGAQWHATGSFDHSTIDTRTTSPVGAAALMINPNVSSRSDAGKLDASIEKAVTFLPAGPLRTRIDLNASVWNTSSEVQSVGSTPESVVIAERDFKQTLDVYIPLINPATVAVGNENPAGSFDVRLGVLSEEVSGFGTLYGYHGLMSWSPLKTMNLSFQMSDTRTAPTRSQFSDPSLITPNMQVFDYVTGQSVYVSEITGGNDRLLASDTRELNLGLWFRPDWKLLNNTSARFARQHIANPISTLPPGTASVEAAFPDQYLRNANGVLQEIDNRYINLDSRDIDHLRIGALSFLNLKGVTLTWSVRDDWIIRDRLRLRGGLPELDILDGAPAPAPVPADDTSSAPGADYAPTPGPGGGEPRHHLSSSLLLAKSAGNRRSDKSPLSMQLKADYWTATQVGEADDASIDPLYFSSVLKVSVNVSTTLSQRFAAIGLQGTTVALEAGNLSNAHSIVRDATGSTPLAFQAAYLDPLGRTFQLSLRKNF